MGMEEIVKQAANPDYATPALYFFSTVAQTMGAIIAIVLAALYAILPNIMKSSNFLYTNKILSLIKRDRLLMASVISGFLCIILSFFSLLIQTNELFININNSRTLFWSSIVILFLFIISSISIWFFITNNVNIYNNPKSLSLYIENTFNSSILSFFISKNIRIIYYEILVYMKFIYNEDRFLNILIENIDKRSNKIELLMILMTYINNNYVSNYEKDTSNLDRNPIMKNIFIIINSIEIKLSDFKSSIDSFAKYFFNLSDTINNNKHETTRNLLLNWTYEEIDKLKIDNKEKGVPGRISFIHDIMLLNWHFHQYKLGIRDYDEKCIRRFLDQTEKGNKDGSFDSYNALIINEVDMFLIYYICSLLFNSYHKLLTNSEYTNLCILNQILILVSITFKDRDPILMFDNIHNDYNINKYGTEILFLIMLCSRKPLNKKDVLDLITKYEIDNDIYKDFLLPIIDLVNKNIGLYFIDHPDHNKYLHIIDKNILPIQDIPN